MLPRSGIVVVLAVHLVCGAAGVSFADEPPSGNEPAGPQAEDSRAAAPDGIAAAASAAPPAAVAPPAAAAPAPAPAATPAPAPGPVPRSEVATQSKPDGDAGSNVFFGGVRLGFEATSGEVTVEGSQVGPGFSSSTTVSYRGNRKIPLTVDVGARLSPNVTLGAYGRLAAVPGGEVDVSWSLGGVFGVLPAPRAAICPWIALAIGYQSLGAGSTLTGPEVSPQLGVLFRVGTVMLGPVAELILVNYSAKASLCADCSGWSTWGALGLRVGWM